MWKRLIPPGRRKIRGFDLALFRRANSDLAELSDAEVWRYLFRKGWRQIREGRRRFHPYFAPFDEALYQGRFPDVRAAVASGTLPSAYEHFRKHGYLEIVSGSRGWPEYRFASEEAIRGILRQSGWFDADYYLRENPEVAQTGFDPLEHFLRYGGMEGRRPDPRFDSDAYLRRYPEVKESGLNPLLHYLLVGQKEGREIGPLFLKTEEGEAGSLPLVSRPSGQREALRIAVVIHAFYLDVLEDIVGNLDNISPRPDLFVSISESADPAEVERFLTERGYRAVVRPVRNRGRDVAPFLIEFAKELESYDLCCKIHGKKSLYAGSEQSDWRNHLYYNLLGSREIVDDIVNAFAADEKLGMLFSDNYGMLPYWGYTWLTNRPHVPPLLAKLGVPELAPILERTYIDYAAGTMFWFRPEAIRQVLNASFSYEDFPQEPIPNDGTTAHTLERLFTYVCRLNGFDYIEQNWKRRRYLKNTTHKNFNQLEAKTLETARRIVDSKRYILFDIFDTLVTRPIFYPDNLFRMLEIRADRRFGRKTDFMRIRKEAENRLRQELAPGEDVGYDAIYDAMADTGTLSPEELAWLREEDFSMELGILRPRPEVVELLKYAIDAGKAVIFVSDMYLSKAQVCSILERCGIPYEPSRVFVSSETGVRKDAATVWPYLIERKIVEPARSLMIGDNEVSDAKIPGDFAIESFHLFSERTAFFESPMGREFRRRFPRVDAEEMTLLGPVVSRLFASPFSLKKTVIDGEFRLSPEAFGYAALGPVFYLFLDDLARRHRGETIFFLARDGYFIRELYAHYCASKNLEVDARSRYLEISRRAVLGAVEKDAATLKSILYELGEFRGSFAEMIRVRLGLDDAFMQRCALEDFSIESAEDLRRAYRLLEENLQEVNRYARREREGYLAYLESIGFLGHDKAVLVDLGYSGTIQSYLHRLTEMPLEGEYFITTKRVEKLTSPTNRMRGFFGDRIDPSDLIGNIVYRYSLVLESYLVSDKGQLIRFDKTEKGVQPVYKPEHPPIDVQREITRGIRAYIDDLAIVPPGSFDPEKGAIRSIALYAFEYLIRTRSFDAALQSIFRLEDDFTGNRTLDILKIFDERGV